MISSWRRRRAARHAGKNKNEPEDDNGLMEPLIPRHFRCPISQGLMQDPVTLSTGITNDPHSNETAKVDVMEIPLSSFDVMEILSKVAVAREREDGERCLELVVKIKALAKESERNRRCMVANGTGSALSAVFEAFSEGSYDRNCAVLEEILSALTLMFPLDEVVKCHLGSSASLNCMVWFVKCGELSGRSNSVLVLKELVSLDQHKVDALAEIEGAMDALVKLIKEPICPATTKALLVTFYFMVSPSSSASSSPLANEKTKIRLIEMGVVSSLIEVLVDAERSTWEKALGVLDGLCSCDEGREKAYSHALTIPVVVKKILRVSDLATEFSVSILWKLSKNENKEDGGVLVEALQVGAFQKLLLLLQVGCSDRTKDKASELLKLLNLHRDRSECIDSVKSKDLTCHSQMPTSIV